MMMSMSLQTIFYIVGIIYMSVHIFLLLICIALLIYIKKKMTHIYEQTEDIVKNVQTSVHHPEHFVSTIAMSVTHAALDQLGKIFITKPKKLRN